MAAIVRCLVEFAQLNTMTETVPLFKHLEFEFLLDYDVFAPASRGEHEFTSHQTSFAAFYTTTTRTSTVHVRLYEDSSTALSGSTADSTNHHLETPLTSFSPVSNTSSTMSSTDSTYSIDSTHIEAIQYNDAASWNYDPTGEEHYYAFAVRSSQPAQRFRSQRSLHRPNRQTERRRYGSPVTRITVDTPIWMLEDSAYDILDWHDHLLDAGVVPIAPYNPRNTYDPKDIEYRFEDRIVEYSEDVQLKRSILDETYNNRTGVERTNGAVKNYGLGHVRARGRVHARIEVFLALCLRLVVAITNHEQGNEPGCEKL